MSQSLTIYDFADTAIYDSVTAVRDTFQRVLRGEKAAPLFARLAAADGRRPKTFYGLMQRWLEGNCDDLILVDRRRYSELWERTAATALPAEFVRWCAGRMLDNQRKSRPAWREIIRQWKRWRRSGRRPVDEHGVAMFPGYDAPPPPADSAEWPAGWSYENLRERANNTPAELALAREGTAAAKKFVPQITGTRAGLRWLEWVLFDDFWHKRKCMVPGYREPARILQIGCLDVATAVYLGFGLRPELPRDDGTRERLKKRDMLMVVAQLLLTHGFPTDYVMHIVVERATATLTLAEARFLYDVSGGQIQVGWSTMEGQFVLAWEEEKSGNPDAKGALESWHNLFANEMGALPGQTGRNPANQPATLLHSDREAALLNDVRVLLPERPAARLLMPYPGLDEAHAETLQIVAQINDRRDHALEDFALVNMFRLRGTEDWQEPALIDRVDPALVEHLEFLPVLEKPRERMERLRDASTIAFPPAGAMVRFYEDSHYLARVARRQAAVRITANRKTTTFVFGPDHADDLRLPEGAEVQLHFDPLNPRFALVTSGGLFVGAWPRQATSRNDAEAGAIAHKRKGSFLAQTVSSVRGKQREKFERERRRMDENLATLAEADMIPAQALADLAAGREVRVTDVAAGMVAAHADIRAAAKQARETKTRRSSAAKAGRAVRESRPLSTPATKPTPEKW